jgi:5-formyltetrahydrofolate cyclo-ligase
MEDNASRKRALRREVRARLRAMSLEARTHASAEIRERLLKSPQFREARTLHCYMSLPLEVDTAPLLRAAFEGGKRVYVPFQIPERDRLGVAAWTPGLNMAPGPLGILEPGAEHRLQELPEPIDLVLVPGLAFDRKGNRLGRGKGYYDRFLASLPPRPVTDPASRTALVALAFAHQVVPEVPRDPWDVPVSHILTEIEAILTFER